MKHKYGSWRQEIEATDDVAKAARLGFFVLMWLGIFWAAAVWMILWVVRSSGYTDFSVTWWKLVVTSMAVSLVRAMDVNIRK